MRSAGMQRLVGVGLATAAIAAALAAVAPDLRAAHSVGRPPPEWTASGGGWPAHNHDLGNTRATTRTTIDSSTVGKLKVRWRFAFAGTSSFGAFASTPIVLGNSVYLQDLNSNVFALDRASGRVLWKHAFDDPNVGPNGVSYGWGRLYGATTSNAFSLDPKSGRLLWSRALVRSRHEGIEIAPQLYDGTVLVSTVPSKVTGSYRPGGLGVVWALDARTGMPKWTFDTVAGGAQLWGNSAVNSGGGLWYPPAVDDRGRVFAGVGNPAPFPGTRQYPNGSSRPGANLYTDSLVALDGKTGKLLWYQQAVPHDVRDYDLMISPLLARLPIAGVPTEVVIAAGKMGKVYAYRADDGKPLWTVAVGRHENDVGPLPSQTVAIYPGALGGVETPMALSAKRVFVPWLDLATNASAASSNGLGPLRGGRGGLTALDAESGKLLWQRTSPAVNFGAATVANDVVFTSTYDGTIYAFATATGKQLWTSRARAGINSFPAITGNMLLVGAATTGFFKHPRFELTAYAIG